ncbi:MULTISPECIES: hypothetical protein [Bradyrhizobium]|uniref:hypothetical protein n=1 Tax=Bradyrhizobium elkanii TaxID=29448 RepID=UPI002715465C|nr:hypothetical protein [Bradyrhizobium elkanii]WLA45097.1 hypothetical protein QIH80_24570 [Bradyrhizobium elkanii]WLB84759.1 hypothetical protein QIH83_20330 [Bradyrhizobium elkanii]
MQMHMDAVAMPVNPPDATDEAGLRVQNTENNPMHRCNGRGTRKSALTRRANQRYFSIIPK